VTLLPKGQKGCPFLILAPMEGVGDRTFRRALATIGGFDEAVRDFLRVPKNAHVKSLARQYDSQELSPIPLAAQVMGADPDLVAEMGIELEKRGAGRIDLNCGCPSNTVTGRGAGSSLLKEPNFLHEIAKALVKAVSVPVTIKMRSGFDDTGLFTENLLAAEASGARYITLHPRTKQEGYGPPARWDLITHAKKLLKIPVVGNGDILSVDDALRMLHETGCDALMIGRGSVINPFIFHQIKAHFGGNIYRPTWDHLERFVTTYLTELPIGAPEKLRIAKLKQLFGFLFKGNAALLERRQEMLTFNLKCSNQFLSFAFDLLRPSIGY
jgi:tRNA-dihydrouridine synthase C